MRRLNYFLDSQFQNEDDEFEHFTDEDEFEGFDREGRTGKGKSQDVPDLKIAKVSTCKISMKALVITFKDCS